MRFAYSSLYPTPGSIQAKGVVAIRHFCPKATSAEQTFRLGAGLTQTEFPVSGRGGRMGREAEPAGSAGARPESPFYSFTRVP